MSFTTALKTLKRHPQYAFMRGVGRFACFRDLMVFFRKLRYKKRTDEFLLDCRNRMDQSIFRDVDLEGFLTDLRMKGVALGLQLPSDVVQELIDYAQNNPCYAYRCTTDGFYFSDRNLAEIALKKPILLAQYFNTTAECNVINRLMNDPLLQWVATAYLRSAPVFVGANMWWTFPVIASDEDRNEHAHLFHRDMDDYRFFKFFFYLTDVNAGEGAHVCIAASHGNPPKIKIGDRWVFRRYSDEEIERFYKPTDIMEICGPAGSGFAENTLCVHKGRTPITKERLLLQLQYALFDYGVTDDNRDRRELHMIA